MTLDIISSVVLGVAVVVALWDVEDQWKRLFLYLVIFVSLLGIRFAEYDAGYEHGVKDAVCILNDISGDC